MAGRIERAAHAGDIAGHAGCRLVVGGEHRLDLMVRIGGQDVLETLDRYALAPLNVDHFDIEALTLAEIDPEMGELAEAGDQHLVARRQRVGHGRFPAAGARGGKEEDLAAFRLEDLLEIGEERQRELGQVGRPLVFHRNVDCAAHALGDVGGPRNEESRGADKATSHLGFPPELRVGAIWRGLWNLAALPPDHTEAIKGTTPRTPTFEYLYG